MRRREDIEELHRTYITEELTLAEAGQRIGVTRERIRQIFKAHGLRRLSPAERGEIIRRRNRAGGT